MQSKDNLILNSRNINAESQLVAWGKRIVDIMQADEKVVLLTAELATSCKLGPALKKFPQRVINTGIAEQNMVSIAAGLASEGYKPYIYSFAAFLSMRGCEQVRTDIFYNNLDVKIIGTHSGLSSGPAGPTHYSLEDIGIIRSMPRSRVVVPADVNSALKVLESIQKISGPIYIRLDRNPLPDVYSKKQQHTSFEFGKANILRHGRHGVLIADGAFVSLAMDVADALRNIEMEFTVMDMSTVKPIDEDSIKAHLSNKPICISLEEHNIFGGLGSAVAEVIASNGLSCKLKVVGIEDIYPKGGPVVALRESLGFAKEKIIENILWSLKNTEVRV